eukprot:gene38607-52160_t
MVELQPSKLAMRVRFPPPAPALCRTGFGGPAGAWVLDKGSAASFLRRPGLGWRRWSLFPLRSEVTKVTWPSRKETMITTGLVFALSALAALFFFVADQIMAKRWYVVHVYSGFEKKIAEQIKEQARQKGLADQFDEVLVPSEEVVELRRGQKINAERKFFPGYVLVKMELTDDAWHLVKDTPKVTGFLGTKLRPSPITEAEADRIIKQAQEGVERPRPAILFEIGEQVRVADGPFTSFNGIVEEIDEEKGRVKVSVSIFGRSTPVELEYSQVEKN